MAPCTTSRPTIQTVYRNVATVRTNEGRSMAKTRRRRRRRERKNARDRERKGGNGERKIGRRILNERA